MMIKVLNLSLLKSERSENQKQLLQLQGYGCVNSCVGPMLDVQMRSELFYQDKFLISQITPVFSLMRDLFLPSVYDAFLVLRPACHFRDARVLSHSTAHLREYFRELPFHESYFLGLIHLLPVNYSSRFQSFFFSISFLHEILCQLVGGRAKPIMLQRSFKCWDLALILICTCL